MSLGRRSLTISTHLEDRRCAAREEGGREDEEEYEEEVWSENRNREVEDPLVEAVERAVEEALEMLLRDDSNIIKEDDYADTGNASDQDSITTACRAVAEQSLRDELALADSDYLLLASWCRGCCNQARSFHKGADHTTRRIEDNYQDQEWWLELKEDSVAATSITAASSSWTSSHSCGGGRGGDISTGSAPGEHFDDSWSGLDCLPPAARYWENLLVNFCDDRPQQRMDLVVACNLLAVALDETRNSRRWRSPPALLWRGWKQQLDDNFDAEVWTTLVCNSSNNDSQDDDTYRHLVLLAVPMLGGTNTAMERPLSKRMRRRCAFGFLTDTWSRYLTSRNDDYNHIQEID